MTLRMVSRSPSATTYRAPDFSTLTSIEARRRVAQLMRLGLSEHTVALLVGWTTNDVRRALAERGESL
jgi:hypothetical protein